MAPRGSVPTLVRDSLAVRAGAAARRLAARAIIRRGLDLHVTGLEHVPEHGAAILVARHYHHVYDATAILASVRREVHVLIAVDWLGGGWRLALMRWLAAAARWPTVWRRGSAWRVNRDGYRSSLKLLREGRLLLVFPEGYPTVDPRGRTRPDADAFLPFDPGFLVLAQRAACELPIVPVGLRYARHDTGRWRLWLRFGAPVTCRRAGRSARQAALETVQSAVRELSAPLD